MTKSLNKGDKFIDMSRSRAINLLLITILDTTWRAFVPTIGGTIIGVVIDNQLNTKPWWTAIMITIGCVVSGLLIFLQLREVNKK